MDFSAGTLFASLLVSSIGFSFFIYGKKQGRAPQFCAGLLLMSYTYFVTGPVVILSVAGVLLLAMYGALRAGL